MTPDTETVSWVRLVLAFSVVFALLGGLGMGLKYIKTRGIVFPNFGGKMPSAARLQVVESIALDLRRRLVIVRCDGNEHLLLLGNEHDIVVDTRIGKNQLSSGRATSESSS
jgi:flagellar protein FliO/FliZ